MRVLVTGATGFIGRHLLPRLAAEHETIGLVRRQPTQPIPGVTYITQELTAALDLARLPHQVDAIIHQAALIDTESISPSLVAIKGGKQGDQTDTTGADAAPFLANVVATWRLLRYAQQAGVRCFVYASTGGVYGCGDTAFVESDPYNPLDLYSLTKSQAELAVRHTPVEFPKIILRYFFPYGVGTPNPIPSYVQRAIRGESIALNADGTPHFNPIHIDDTVEATLRALSLPVDTTLNIAGIEITTYAEIVAYAAQRAGRRPNITLISGDAIIPYYRGNLLANTEAMQRTLEFTPQVQLSTGLAALVDSYLGQ
jgi:UDP-glucose 4-epimerase